MDWFDTVSVWAWEGANPIQDIPCIVSDLAPDTQLPPSEYGRLGRTQQRLVGFRLRCSARFLPIFQQNNPIVFKQSDTVGIRNPFGRRFSHNQNGESLFIRDMTVHRDILDIELYSLVTNPLGVIAIAPAPDVPELYWYWEGGFPDSFLTQFTAKAIYTDSLFNPIADIRSESDVEAFIRTRYRLPDNLDDIKLSVVDGQNRMWNIKPLDTTITLNFVNVVRVTQVRIVDTGITGIVGQVGLEITCVRGTVGSFDHSPILGQTPIWWLNGDRVVVWNASDDTPYYDDRITSRYGDRTFRTSA